MKLTAAKAKRVIALYYEHGRSPTRAFRQFNNWAIANHIHTRVTKKNVMDVMKRFQRNEELQKACRNKPSQLQDEEFLFRVLNSLKSETASLSSASSAISQTVR
jgi:hypothetical protein